MASTENPFEAPSVEPTASVFDAPESSAPVYSPVQIGVSAYLGTPVAAGILMHRNQRGRPEAQRTTLIVTVALSAALVALALFVPDNFPMRYINIGYSFGFHAWAKNFERGVFDRRASEPGGRHSWWGVIGISIASALAFGGGLSLVLYFVDPEFASLFES